MLTMVDSRRETRTWRYTGTRTGDMLTLVDVDGVTVATILRDPGHPTLVLDLIDGDAHEFEMFPNTANGLDAARATAMARTGLTDVA